MEPEVQESRSDLMIPVDIRVDDDGYFLTALIPGVTAEELNIQIVNETVSIQGEMRNTRNENDRFLLSELPSGQFTRVLTLPDELDATKAEADIAHGILTLRIPKAEDAKPKSIKVIAK
jgi:HSP20 family protein